MSGCEPLVSLTPQDSQGDFAFGRLTGELQRVRHDGAAVIISSRLALWCDAKGKPRAVLATNNDSTVRKQDEQALERSEAVDLPLDSRGTRWPNLGGITRGKGCSAAVPSVA